jgi:hypothetical protein
MCQDAIIGGMLSTHGGFAPLLGIYEDGKFLVFVYKGGENGTLYEWIQRSDPSLPEKLGRVSISATKLSPIHL